MKLSRVLVAVGAAVLLVLSYSSTSLAKCASHSLRVWPEAGQSLPANSPLIIVEGYGMEQKSIAALSDQNLQLVSGDHRVAVAVVETLESRMRLTHAVLRAKGRLEPGQTYRLTVELESIRNAGIRIVRAGDAEDEFSARSKTWRWKIVESDTSAPQFLDSTKKGNDVYTPYGCGPASYVEIHPSLVHDEWRQAVFLARVQRHDDPSDVQRFYVMPSSSGPLRIGHHMCSGAFELEPGETYKLTLWAVDRAGHRSEPWIFDEITGPQSR